ncbi:MAG: hypothetical protein A2255_06675 [Candidatus Melainabacteria bacterium RIFOXYA2_FULL_32_9]|nr:MAG: hypothetical protein A2255_06675 [Candidatus Melainabacteria bacterium RIFOXYA2_FULL_32_9]
MNKLNFTGQKLEKYVSFLGKRTDHNLVNQLTQDSGSLFKPKERQILEAIDRISADNSNENIEFLLSVAEDLKYGVKKNSALGSFLDRNSTIANNKNKQNVNWEEILKTSIKKALDNNTADNKSALEDKFTKLFPEPVKTDEDASKLYWLSANPTVQKEQEAVSLRNKILDSKEFNKAPVNISQEEAQELQGHKESSKRNIDYFLASSEASIFEKVECLKLLSHLMSPEYKINPQLKDKKVQILSETLNDLIVKTPDEDKLAIKKTNQRYHGMCAAISIVRKALPHEHKLTHVANLLSEFDDKPTMEVYDVTDHKKKITVEKPKLDFTEAIRQGYRIADASALNWMHIADSAGNGELQGQKFIPFDKENYGMMQDSHLVLDMAPEYRPEQNLLRAAIKTKEIVKDLEKEYNKRDKADGDDLDARLTRTANLSYTSVFNTLKELSPQSDERKIASLSQKLLYPKEVEDKNLRIDSREDDLVKKQKLISIIHAEIPELQESRLNSVINKIFNEYTAFESVIGESKEKAREHSPESKATHYENLFKLAAYYRVQKERELDIPEKLDNLAKELKAPAQKEVLLKKLENRGDILPRKTLDSLQAKFDEILKYREQEKLARREGKKLEMPEPYTFSEGQKEILKKIESDYSKIRRETVRNYKDLNHKLAPQLDELYNRAGKTLGHYYVGEEGRSGLYTGQQARIITQASGTPHYVEGNVQKSADHIQNGKGGSVDSTNVSNKKYTGHAQYLYDVDYADIIDPKTGRKNKERVFYHDNTWGEKEKDSWDKVWGSKNDKYSLWKDPAGNLRTDYGTKGYGGEYGYIFSPNYTTGVTESDFISALGTNKVKIPNLKGLEIYKEDKYPVFMDMILRGENADAEEESNDLMQGVLSRQGSKNTVKTFFDRLKDNYGKKIPELDSNFEKVSKIEKESGELKTDILKLIRGSDSAYNKQLELPGGIESRKDLDKIPNDHPVKIILKKACMMDIIDQFSPGAYESVINAKTSEELDNIHNYLIDVQKNNFKNLFKNDSIKALLDQNVNLVSEFEKAPLGKAVVNWIDKKFEPKDDKAFMEVYKNLTTMDSKKLDELLENSNAEELGIKLDDPYTFVQRIRGMNEGAMETLSDIIFKQTYYKVLDEIKQDNTENGKVDSSKQAMYIIYRTLSVALSHLNSLENKEQIFNQYGVRSAIPEISVYSQETIKQNAAANLKSMGKVITAISELKQNRDLHIDDPLKFEETDKQIKFLKQGLNVMSNTFVKANIIPRDQDKIIEMLNKWTKDFGNNPGSKETQQSFIDTVKQVGKSHLTEHPKEFLNYMTKELLKIDQNNLQKDSSDSVLVDAWSNYMTASLKAAQNARLEFELMNNIGEGKMSQIAEQFKDPSFALKIRGENKSLTSPEGLDSIINALRDSNNKESTLKLFVEHTGLTNNVVNYLMRDKPAKYVQSVKGGLEVVNQHGKELTLITKTFKEFVESIPKDQIASIKPKEFANNYFAKIEEIYKQNGFDTKETLAGFKQQVLKNIDEMGGKGINLFANAFSKSVNQEIQAHELLAQSVGMFVEDLEDKGYFLSVFDELIPNRSDLKVKSKNYQIEVKKALNEVSNIFKK